MDNEWKQCCKDEIADIWKKHDGPMNIVRYIGNCPTCGHFIGLTQTSKEEAEKFLAPMPPTTEELLELDSK